MEDIIELNKYLIPDVSNIVDTYLTGGNYQHVMDELNVLIYYHNYSFNYTSRSLFLITPRILEYHRINKRRRKLLKY